MPTSGATGWAPALLTQTSSRPKRSTARSATASATPSSRRSPPATAARVAELGDQRRRLVAPAAVVHDDGRTGLAQPAGDAGADARGGPGHHGHATVEVEQRPNGRRVHGRSPRAGRITRRSVTMAVIRSAGVTSKAGLNARDPAGAVRRPS